MLKTTLSGAADSRHSSLPQVTPAKGSNAFVRLGVACLYLALALAAIFYVSHSNIVDARNAANQIVIAGFISSLSLLLVGWLVSLKNNHSHAADSTHQSRCPLLSQPHRR
jgi:hypothetical protein